MAQRLKSKPVARPAFPSWVELAAVALLVVWLFGLLTTESAANWVHLLLPVAFGILAISFWNDRPRPGDS